MCLIEPEKKIAGKTELQTWFSQKGGFYEKSRFHDSFMPVCFGCLRWLREQNGGEEADNSHR
jgi:hypothetical protein